MSLKLYSSISSTQTTTQLEVTTEAFTYLTVNREEIKFELRFSLVQLVNKV